MSKTCPPAVGEDARRVDAGKGRRDEGGTAVAAAVASDAGEFEERRPNEPPSNLPARASAGGGSAPVVDPSLPRTRTDH